MTPQELSNEILSELEKEKIIAFCEDKLMFEAVKKQVLAVAIQGTFEKNIPFVSNRNYALNLAWGACDGTGMPRTDEELGQDLRALTKAVQLVGSGFKGLTDMKEEVEAEKAEVTNPAE